MKLLAYFRSIASALLYRSRLEGEMDEELRAHIQDRAADLECSGLARVEAERRARLEFGGYQKFKEECREATGVHFFETILQDVRYGLRMLRKSPGFTAVAILTLALGIGANTAIFSLINALMLRTLPVRDPGRLVELLHQYPGEPAFNGFSWDAYQIMRDHNHVLSDLIVDSPGTFTLHGQKLEPRTVFGGYVNGTFFETLGLRASIGRSIGPEDDHMGHPSAIAVVGWSYWKGKLNSDPEILGKQIIVNDVPVTIVGVTEQGFSGLSEEMGQDIWLPVSMEPVIHHSALEWGSLGLVGRLKPGVSIEQARAEMAVLFQSVIQSAGPFVKKMKFEMEPAGTGLSTPLRRMLATPLTVLMVIVNLLLLIACTNVASLLLARGASRQQEIAVRVCLGAGRTHLMRQALTESLLLSVAGSLIGVFLAYFGGRGLIRILTSGREIVGLPVHVDILIRPDLHVLLFTSTIALLTAILFGAAPAMRALNVLPAFALQQAARSGESRSQRLFGKSLVVSQVALSVVLLSAAALFVGYLSHLRNLNLGFDRSHLLLVALDPEHSGYDAAQLSRLSQELLGQLEAIPGVRLATLSGMTPISGAGASSFAIVEGRPESRREVSINWVAPNYFKAYDTPLLAGRGFFAQDRGGAPVAIINQAMARDAFGSNSPIGSHVALNHATSRRDDKSYEIVGVVGDAKYNDIQQAAPRTIYLDAFQEDRVSSQLTLQTSVDPEAVASAVRQSVASVLKTVPIVRVTTMNGQIDASIVPERLIATLSGCFGALGALLAAVGLYGVLAYTVARRTNEIGIRMALGATRGNVTWMVLRDALGIVCVGLAIGAPISFWGKSLATHLIADLPAKSIVPIVFGIVAMIAVALLAAYIPARRAMRVDLMVALRYE